MKKHTENLFSDAIVYSLDAEKQTEYDNLLADKVGYNSKSSFNTALKKHTSSTPSEYRKNLKIHKQ